MRSKAPLFDKAIAGLSLVCFGFMVVALCRFFLKAGSVISVGFPSAILLCVITLLPSIELRQDGCLKLFGKSFRAFFILAADRLFSGDRVFASIYWEITAVGIALLIIFFLPLPLDVD